MVRLSTEISLSELYAALAARDNARIEAIVARLNRDAVEPVTRLNIAMWALYQKGDRITAHYWSERNDEGRLDLWIFASFLSHCCSTPNITAVAPPALPRFTTKSITDEGLGLREIDWALDIIRLSTALRHVAAAVVTKIVGSLKSHEIIDVVLIIDKKFPSSEVLKEIQPLFLEGLEQSPKLSALSLLISGLIALRDADVSAMHSFLKEVAEMTLAGILPKNHERLKLLISKFHLELGDFNSALSTIKSPTGHVTGPLIFQQGIIELTKGELISGFLNYSRGRIYSAHAANLLAGLRVLDNPENLAENLIIYADQGVGDIIFFSCFLARCTILQKFQNLFIIIPDRVRDLLASLKFNNKVRLFNETEFLSITSGIRQSNNFRWIYISAIIGMEIAFRGLHGRTLEPEFFSPNEGSFLGPEFYKIKGSISESQKAGGPTMGISWRCTNPRSRAKRDTNIEFFSQLTDSLGFRHVRVFQHEINDQELEFCVSRGWNICDAGQRNVLDFAISVSECDFILTVGNTLAHMAGALGLKGIVLLPMIPREVWPCIGDRVPWYPSLRCVRGDFTASSSLSKSVYLRECSL